jgi:thiol:disulfide interchange protein DsbC
LGIERAFYRHIAIVGLPYMSSRAFRHGLVLAFVASLSCVSVEAAEQDLARLKDALVKAFPDTPVETLRIRPSVLPGLYEVIVDTQLFYISADGRFVFLGDLVDIETRSNLSEQRREALVREVLDGVSEKDMIVIGPADAKRTITVFTDVDCPYCARFHLDVPELNRHGVKVRYLLFPRGGVDSETYRRSVAVWCAADRAKAIGLAKAGKPIEMKTCPNPVARHYQLGERLGVSGTPTIFLDTGRRVVGYVPAPQLLSLLGLRTAPRAARSSP